MNLNLKEQPRVSVYQRNTTTKLCSEDMPDNLCVIIKHWVDMHKHKQL